ncbi:MAG: hypothetical protein FWG99_08190 [Treponema sp.]|nr:hypothetical protein [Treponema sp.]
MSLFCFLFVPLFYLFRRSFSGGGGSGGVWALLLGSLNAIFQFSLGYFINPGGFGFSRWLYGFVDIVSLPVIVPVLLYALLTFFRIFRGTADFANFTLLWLIPVAALRSITWSVNSNAILLVLVPVLWTALAVGISFFIGIVMTHSRWYITVFITICILALLTAAALAYWAFFSQQTLLGLSLLCASILPAVISVLLDIFRAGT